MSLIYQEERLYRILEYLEGHEAMTVNEICAIFGVSRDTARRDVVKLAERGAVIRTHGGIALPKFDKKIQEYAARQRNEPQEKLRIGEYAATLVEEDEILFLDVSTTVQCLIPRLRAAGLTVVTHSLDNAWLLMEEEAIQTYLLGGLLHPKLRHMTGYGTLKKLEDYRFTKAFLGAAGITGEGIYYYDEDDIYFKQELVRRAEQVIVLADHTKFDQYSLFRALELPAIDIIITDQPVSRKMQKALDDAAVELVIASG
ncbi:DeoR/GlpR family DNA-binding transcription regulator [Hydrogenispora ethanolica]|uniref:DeoR/GlpR family DNA-binding transcription regulator n=1 Tax=Hydrogenispora ethanolica TaxID=1082276 RepID=UPI0010438A64|nr:DeoR/GlpR family DNA-binding transcription regulator [Hydrogenispora ethanolica]